jgi:hypothetical protein
MCSTSAGSWATPEGLTPRTVAWRSLPGLPETCTSVIPFSFTPPSPIAAAFPGLSHNPLSGPSVSSSSTAPTAPTHPSRSQSDVGWAAPVLAVAVAVTAGLLGWRGVGVPLTEILSATVVASRSTAMGRRSQRDGPAQTGCRSTITAMAYFPPAVGSPKFGSYSVNSGVTVKMGLVWGFDPGPIYLTASCETIPSYLEREHPTRELSAPKIWYDYETTEWITVTATSSTGGVDGISLSYIATAAAEHNIDFIHETVHTAGAYHVVADEGRAVAWVRAVVPVAGAPVPVIAPSVEGHTLHLDVEIDGDESDSVALAELLGAAIALR